MSRKILAQDAYDRVKLIHGDTVTLDVTTFIKASSPAKFIDKDYGEWWALLKTVIRGSRHTDFKCVNFKNCRLLTNDYVKQKIFEKHGDTVKLAPGQKYKTSHTKIFFLDKDYGTWLTTPFVVMGGHGHPARGQHNRSKKSKLSVTLNHWKTSIELICTASYEVAVVSWLNKNKFDYDWQVPVQSPFGTYYIDLLIKDGEFVNTWIEIKGTWDRKNGHIGKQKWEWFHENYPNSQLWMHEDLLKLEIINNESLKRYRELLIVHNL